MFYLVKVAFGELWCFRKLLLLDLRHLKNEPHCNNGKNKLGEHKLAVVDEGIHVFAHALGCQLSPDNNSREEVAKESEYHDAADGDSREYIGLAAADEGKAEKGEGYYIVEQGARHRCEYSVAIGENVSACDSLKQLEHTVKKCRRKTCLEAVSVAHKKNGKH